VGVHRKCGWSLTAMIACTHCASCTAPRCLMMSHRSQRAWPAPLSRRSKAHWLLRGLHPYPSRSGASLQQGTCGQEQD
jgi:hypothetical protein